MADYTLTPAEEEKQPYTLTPAEDEPVETSKAFSDRLSLGGALKQNFMPLVKGFEGAKEAFGDQPLGLSQEHVKALMDAGIFRDPATGRGGALRFTNEALIMPASVMGDAVVRGAQAVVGGVSSLVGQLVREAPNNALGSGDRAQEEVSNLLNYQLLRGDQEFGRIDHAEGKPYDTPIGIHPAPQDFHNAAANIAQRPDPDTESNLRDLWRTRGIHPAEAATDAANDNLLKSELTTKPYNLPDTSGIPHPTNTPIFPGTPRSELARTGEPHIDRLLNDDILRNVIDNPIIDNTHEIPNSWGGSVPLSNPVTYIDKEFPRTLTVDGVTFDPAHGAVIHENIEELVIQKLMAGGMPRDAALRAAYWGWGNPAEHAWYKAHGMDPDHVEAALKPYLDQIATRKPNPANIPADLFKDTYPGGNPLKDVPGGIDKPSNTELAQAKKIMGGELEAAPEGKIRSVGAAATDEFQEAPKRQVRSPIGRAVEAGRKGMDELYGLGRNIQYLLDPMSVGSDRAMVVAKDTLNTVRRIQFEHQLADQELMRNFSFEQQQRMWNALSEENVLRRQGITPPPEERAGLAALSSKERAAVEKLLPDSQQAWLHAVDVGLVKGEGQGLVYDPRMVIGMSQTGMGPRALNELGRNVFTRTGNMLHRKYLLAEETEEAAKSAVRKQMEEAGATPEAIEEAVKGVKIVRNIRTLPLATRRLQEAAVWKDMINKIKDIGKAAGQDLVSSEPRPGWFTIAGNPAFTEWAPRLRPMTDLETAPFPAAGRMTPELNENGEMIFAPKPIYMPGEFEGPMRAILDQKPTSRIVQGTQTAYGALMALKGKAMTVIMNSPLIHNEVVWAKAVEAVGGKQLGALRLYFRGNKIAYDKQRAAELIEAGLAPIGKRGSFQDISGMAEEPELEAGHSWTAKLAGAIPGLFDEGAEQVTRRAIDKMGDFTHNTLLWDRVRDLQFGLADYFSDELVAKGAPRIAADRMASHFANLIVGSMPKESMSAGARATANLALFSRSFTLGNIAVYKQAVMGLPAPIRAQIERDLLGFKKNPETGTYEMPEDVDKFTASLAKKMAKRKAISTIALSIGFYYVGNALLQNAFNIAFRDSTVPDEMRGYAQRFSNLMKDVQDNPFELRHAIGRLSPTYENEPNKGDRAYIANTKDGTAMYARNPMGKFGEELAGYPTMPAEMVRRKLSPMLSTALELINNDKGYGVNKKIPIYDTNENDFKIAMAVGKYIVERELPEQQLQGAWDLLHDTGDQRLNAMRAFGPIAGFTVSQGMPGGIKRGIVQSSQDAFDTRFSIAWPGIKKQILSGDRDGAVEAMRAIGVPLRMQIGLIRSATNPHLSGYTLKQFYEHATPEEIRRFEAAPQ